MKKISKILSVVSVAALAACSAQHHSQDLHSSHERELTLGTVQGQIHVGMSQSDVAAIMGSPNIVTKGSSGEDSWIYDKIATESSYSKSDVGGGAGLGVLASIGSSVGLGGGASGNGSYSTGAAATTQKTLTVVINFDQAQKVKNINYHSSKF